MPSVYQVWVIDCDACGTRIDYGEDESTIPSECEECGTPVETPTSDNADSDG